ncbi:MAG: hypothetical protein AAFQ07_13735, partial [Chloroflexota bacterium]
HKIHEDTGYSYAIIKETIQWLFEHRAICNVPEPYRMGLAKNARADQTVYLITGIIALNGGVYPTVSYKNPEEKGQVLTIMGWMKENPESQTIHELIEQVDDSGK